MPAKEILIKAFSIVLLFIFFVKMMINVAPFVIRHFDPDAAVMQLETDNNEKAPDSSKEMIKEYLFVSHSCDFLKPVQILIAIPFYYDEDSQLRSFYPSVPTPPPNC